MRFYILFLVFSILLLSSTINAVSKPLAPANSSTVFSLSKKDSLIKADRKKDKKRKRLKRFRKNKFIQNGGIGLLAIISFLIMIPIWYVWSVHWVILIFAGLSLLFSIIGIRLGGKNKKRSEVMLMIFLSYLIAGGLMTLWNLL